MHDTALVMLHCIYWWGLQLYGQSQLTNLHSFINTADCRVCGI